MLSMQAKRYAQKAKANLKKGFTLIELMIVIGILSILAVIAIPQYASYVARAQAAEAVQLLGGAKMVVAEFISTRGRNPTTTELQALYQPALNTATRTNRYVNEIRVATANPAGADFTLEAVFRTQSATVDISQDLSNKSILYAAHTGTQGAVWSCLNSSPTPVLRSDSLPSICQGTAIQ